MAALRASAAPSAWAATIRARGGAPVRSRTAAAVVIARLAGNQDIGTDYHHGRGASSRVTVSTRSAGTRARMVANSAALSSRS